VVVHDIEVNPVGCGLDTTDLSRKIRQVSVEDARRYLDTHGDRLLLAQDREEHCIGAVAVRPQLNRRAFAAISDLMQKRSRILLHNVTSLAEDVRDHEFGLGQVR
jgi:hypothetical protein